MKITIEIDEKEILQEAKRIVAGKVADEILDTYHSHKERYCYRTVIKECVRDAIKKDIDNLSDREVEAASVSIANKALKKKLEKIRRMNNEYF